MVVLGRGAAFYERGTPVLTDPKHKTPPDARPKVLLLEIHVKKTQQTGWPHGSQRYLANKKTPTPLGPPSGP